MDNPSAFGLVITDENGKITKFIEKPKSEEIISDTINAGVYVFQPEVLEEIPSGKNVSVEKETFPQILEEGKEMFGYVHYGYWLDVGTIDKFKKANFDVLDGKISLAYKGSERNIEVDPSSSIPGNVSVDGKLVVGKNVMVKNGVKIKGKVIVGEGCFVGENCEIENSIIFRKTVIGNNCKIEDSIIGSEVIIKDNCYIKNMSLADRSLIYDFTKSGE